MSMQLTVSLTPEQYQFIQEQVQNGRYPSADEAIALALELLEESIYLENEDNQRHYQKWLEETRKKIAIANEQIARGQVVDGEEVFARLRQKIQMRKASQPS